MPCRSPGPAGTSERVLKRAEDRDDRPFGFGLGIERSHSPHVVEELGLMNTPD